MYEKEEPYWPKQRALTAVLILVYHGNVVVIVGERGLVSVTVQICLYFFPSRLWGDHGQDALENAHVCVINATSTGTELLKNLVLPGKTVLFSKTSSHFILKDFRSLHMYSC